MLRVSTNGTCAITLVEALVYVFRRELEMSNLRLEELGCWAHRGRVADRRQVRILEISR